MHIKHIHETIEKLSKYACEEACKNKEAIDTKEMGEVVDMVKDLAEAEYYARIAKAMEETEKEDEEEAKYIMKKMKEEYGEEEGERRFYDDYRYKRSGRFAPKGRGSYMPRRGYDEPPYYHMMPNEAEYYRDMDRMNGKMYYSGGGQSSSGNSSGQSGNMSGNSNMGGNTRGYSDGYLDGNRRGYESGYSDGQRDGRKSNSGNESRYDRAKRGFEETKQMHKGNSQEDKTLTMKEAEKFANVAIDELMEALDDASPEVKNMVKTKVMSKMQKM